MGIASSFPVNPSVLNSIQLLDFEDFESLKAYPKYDDVKEKLISANKITPVTYENSFFVFISHCWLRSWRGSEGWDGVIRPDDAQNSQFRLCCEGISRLKATLASGFTRCYIWMDYSCANINAYSITTVDTFEMIIRLSDCIFTPTYEKYPHLWKLPRLSTQMQEDYNCLGWIGTPYSYLNRAWCRLEMFYGATVPLIACSADRISKFSNSLLQHRKENHRPHILYGSYENYHHIQPTILPPISHKWFDRYHPEAGYLTNPNTDKLIITQLTKTLLLHHLNVHKQGGYHGQYNQAGLREGKGRFVYDNGDVYSGEWFAGRYHGHGEYVFSAAKERKEGYRYEGEWQDGKKQGYGWIVYNSNSQLQEKEVQAEEYEGHWLEDQKHDSAGRYVFLDGSSYYGNFQYDQMTGYGRLTYPTGVLYEGEWLEGKMHGQGKLIYPSTGYVLQGEWIAGEMEGKGQSTTIDGDVYIGEWKENVKQGKGKFMNHNGDIIYEGQYKGNVQHGLGILSTGDGDVLYKGEFQYGRMTREEEGIRKNTANGGEELYDGDWSQDKKLIME